MCRQCFGELNNQKASDDVDDYEPDTARRRRRGARVMVGIERMSLYTTIHLHNVPAGRETEYATWFDGPHRTALSRLRGFITHDRYEVAAQQSCRTFPSPGAVSVYDFDLPNPAIDLPALGPLVAEARDAGMIADDEPSACIPIACSPTGKPVPTGNDPSPSPV